MIEFDCENLTKLLFELEPKRRLQGVRNAFRRTAAKVRKKAVQNLRATGIRTDKDLEKGVRQVLYRKVPGFKVTVGSKKGNANTGKGERGMHLNRRGVKKPVLRWAEDGTKKRHTKGRRFLFIRRKGRYTGQMPRYGFMEKTKNETKDSVTETLREEITKSIKEVSKKYGCS